MRKITGKEYPISPGIARRGPTSFPGPNRSGANILRYARLLVKLWKWAFNFVRHS